MPEQKPKVDGYVSFLLKKYSEELGVKIDFENPSWESRLELALKVDRKGVDHQWSAMEIMVGRRIDSTDDVYAGLFLMYTMGLMTKEYFYKGFPKY